MLKHLVLAVALMLSACDEPTTGSSPNSIQWQAGAPTSKPIAKSFEIPQSGKINYVTYRHGSLKGAKSITLRYRVDMAEGVRIVPATMPEGPSIITLYIQRRGDDWTGKSEMNFYRWYATSKSVMPIVAGEHTITVSILDDKWTAVNAGESYGEVNGVKYRNERFDDAVANSDRIGFVLGGGTGYGHGVSATGPATFTIVSFEVK